MTTPIETAARATLPALLAARSGPAPALLYRDRTLTYAALEDQSRRAAAGLARLGVAPGDRVALWLPNTPAWLVLFLACARLGAIVVSVNTRFRSAEVEDIVGRSGCKVLALWPDFKGIDFPEILAGVGAGNLDALQSVVLYREDDNARSVNRVAEVLPGRRIVDYDALLTGASDAPDPATAESGCILFTTSGTTRKPKFVLHDQKAVTTHAFDVAAGFGYTAPEARMLQATPLCGVFGFCQAMATLAAGRAMVLLPAFDPAEAARIIRERGITHANGADDMMARLLEAVPGNDPFPTLSYFGFAGFNPAQETIIAEAEARGVRMRGLYGSSEVQALFSLQPADAPRERRTRGGGVPVSPEAKVRTRGEDGRLLPPGESGELEFRGPSVMVRYFGDPEATRAAFTADGYYRSGDLGTTTPDGGFVFQSRKGDELRLGGFLVSPAEIEAEILGHPGVSGCQVVGVATARGHDAVAFVTTDDGGAGFDEAAVRDHCRARLAKFKVPARVVRLGAFPTTQSANGTKIQRNRLRDMAQRLMDEPARSGA